MYVLVQKSKSIKKEENSEKYEVWETKEFIGKFINLNIANAELVKINTNISKMKEEAELYFNEIIVRKLIKYNPDTSTNENYFNIIFDIISNHKYYGVPEFEILEDPNEDIIYSKVIDLKELPFDPTYYIW